MKKLFSVLSILMMCSMTVFALGQGETADDGQVTIKVANYAILEKGYEEFWNSVKTGFESENPDIKIEWVTAPYGEIMNQVINMAGGGDRVDVIFGESLWVPGFEDSGLACAVTDILSPEFLADFDQSTLDSLSVNGKPYGIPLYVSPNVLLYNKELFKQAGLDPDTPPKTYDEMLEMAEKLSKLTDKNGNKIYAFGQTTASVPVSGSSLNSLVFSMGGDVLDESGKLSVDNEGFREAFELIQILDQKGYNPQNAKKKDLRNLFALGQLAMYYDQSWGFNGVKSINPDAVNFTASAGSLSGGSGKGESILESHCFILVDNGAVHREAVRKFVEYVISPEVLNDYLADITPAYPARKSMADIPAVTESSLLKGAADSVGNTRTQVYIPTLNDLYLELCSLAQAVSVGKENVDIAIADFKRNAEQKIR